MIKRRAPRILQPLDTLLCGGEFDFDAPSLIDQSLRARPLRQLATLLSQPSQY